MDDLLNLANTEVEEFANRGALPAEELLGIEQIYQQVISECLACHASFPLLPKRRKRGKQKQPEGKKTLRSPERKALFCATISSALEIPFIKF